MTAGILASSLALLSDAAHMLTDAIAIGLSLVAIRLAQRLAKGAMTFGLNRTEILSAQFNGATLPDWCWCESPACHLGVCGGEVRCQRPS